MSVPADRNGCKFARWMMESNPPPTYVKAAGFKGKVDRWLEFEYRAPCLVLQYTGAIDAGKGAKQNQKQPGFHSHILHCATPGNGYDGLLYFRGGNGYRTDDPQATEDFYNELIPTFIEDTTMMSHQQSRIDLDPERPLVNIKSDAALVHARRAFAAAYEAEHDTASAAAE